MFIKTEIIKKNPELFVSSGPLYQTLLTFCLDHIRIFTCSIGHFTSFVGMDIPGLGADFIRGETLRKSFRIAQRSSLLNLG